MTANLNPSYDLSGLLLLEAAVGQMSADQAAGVSSFAGGTQPAGTGSVPTVGRITGTYAAAAAIPLKSLPIGMSSVLSGMTSNETIATLTTRVRAVLATLAKLAH